MDTFAHVFWTWIIFFRYKAIKLALLFGFLPDIMSWGIYLFYRVVKGIPFGPPNLAFIPDWVFVLYGFTHSIFVFMAVFALLWWITKKIPIYVLPWIIHLMIDIPTHTREYLGTPFLWPVSDWLFPGISWGTTTFILTNYVLIVSCISYMLIKKKNIFGFFK